MPARARFAVRQRDPPLLGQTTCLADVVLGDHVAHAAGTGVQEQPDRAVLVAGDFDEVVPGSQGTQLVTPVTHVVGRVETRLCGELLEVSDPRLGRGDDRPVVLPGGLRDGSFDRLPQRCQIAAGELCHGELGAHGDHPAADVHADGSRHDRTEGRDDRADGRALAQVGIGHECQVREDEGHPGGCPCLLEGLLVQHARPGEQVLIEQFHDGVFPCRVVGWCRPGGPDPLLPGATKNDAGTRNAPDRQVRGRDGAGAALRRRAPEGTAGRASAHRPTRDSRCATTRPSSTPSGRASSFHFCPSSDTDGSP
jgi:hypothetical protein